MKKRMHNIEKRPRKGRSHEWDILWKGHKASSELSRLTLCVLYEVVTSLYYPDMEDGEAAQYLPTEKISWRRVDELVLRCLPDLTWRGLATKGGHSLVFAALPAAKRCVRLGSRWENFFHEYVPGKTKRWSTNDSEHPLKHPELLPLMPKARKIVRAVLR